MTYPYLNDADFEKEKYNKVAFLAFPLAQNQVGVLANDFSGEQVSNFRQGLGPGFWKNNGGEKAGLGFVLGNKGCFSGLEGEGF